MVRFRGHLQKTLRAMTIFFPLIFLLCYGRAYCASVNIANGEHTQPFELFKLEGNDYTNSFRLTYKSMDPGSKLIGRGWRHSFTITLTPAGDGTRRDLNFTEKEREQYVFEYKNDTYKPWTENTSLVQNKDGSFEVKIKDKKYLFDKYKHIVKYAGSNKDWLKFDYHGDNLVSVTDSAGNRLSFEYDDRQQISIITSPNGKRFILGHQDNMLSSINLPDGSNYSFEYDDKGFMLLKKDRQGKTTKYIYDADHRVLRSIDSEGKTYNVEYPRTYSTIATTQYTDKEGGIWEYTYDRSRHGIILKKVDPKGGVTNYTYDDHGNVLSENNSTGKTKTYTYDADNRMTGVKDSDGTGYTITYDQNGNVVQIVGDNGETTSYKYNSQNKVTTMVEPDGSTIRLTYDDNGNLLTTTDPQGATLNYKYNKNNQLIEIVGSQGKIMPVKSSN